MGTRVLVADDEVTICRILEHELLAAGFEVAIANDGKNTEELLNSSPFDVAILDINMPFLDGFHVLRSMENKPRRPIIIMITAYGTIESAVKAMQMGASDYITKPFDCELLINKINQLLPARNIISPVAAKKESDKVKLVGKSYAVQGIRSTVEKIKDLKSNVLITGESGTGKGVVAKMIHHESYRASLPFVHVDCASIQPSLIESTLFGHEKGAFTGAVSTQKGKFEAAGSGTIFLDEIGSLEQSLQSRLLIVLQERAFSRIGSTATLAMNARVIAATNEKLEQSVYKGEFREDLYYRLNIIRIHMPPLRERPEDIEELALRFLRIHAKRNDKTTVGFEPQVLQFFQRYEWPGNVRELENAVECAVALAEGEYVTARDIPLYVTDRFYHEQAMEHSESKLSLADREMMTIISTLEKFGGHREKTAEALGISRRTLQYRLKQYGLASKE